MLPRIQPNGDSPSTYDFVSLQTQWAKIIDPIVGQPVNNGLILKNVSLSTGSNVVNHKLSRALQGWFIIRQRGAAAIYDTQDSNPNPKQTLTLNSSVGVNVDILVF